MQSDVNKRRAERRRKARRRHLITGLIVFLIFTLITLVIMSFTVLFKVKQLEITNNKIYTDEEIRNVCGITTKDNLFIVSEKKLINKLRSELPYIDSIEIKRQLPDKLTIVVKDAKEYAYYQKDNNYFILSSSGYILKKQSKRPKDLLEIVTKGIEGSVGNEAKYKDSSQEELINSFLELLDKNDIKLNKINVKNKSQIILEIEDRFTVRFGTKDNTEEKIKLLSSMLGKLSDDTGTINLTMWTPKNRQGSFIPAKEYAYYKNDDNYYTISNNGYVLSKQDNKPDGLFEIVTTGISGTVGEKIEYKDISQENLVSSLAENLNKNDIKFKKIDVKNELFIVLEIEDEIIVDFGSDDNMKEKIKYLSGMLKELQTQKGTIDLTEWTPNNKDASFIAEVE